MKQTIKIAWLLFAALLLLAAVFPFAVFAEGETYTVTVMVKFDEIGGSTSPDDGTHVQVFNATKLSQNTYSFTPSGVAGEMLRLEANSVEGHHFYQWEMKKDDSEEEPTISTTNDYTVNSISGDSTITVVFRPNEYNIFYENEEDFNGGSIPLPVSTPLKHTYGQTTTLVAPNANELQSHTFQYWTVYTTDGSNRTFFDTREAGEDLGAKEFTSDLVLVAHWAPKSFAVTRHDIYFDESGDPQELGTVTESAEFGSSVSGLSDDIWNTNPSYRGYAFNAATVVENSDYPVVLQSVGYVEANNNVYRYYTARTYTVNYENCGGVLNDWGSAGASYRTHTYGKDTVIPNPSRTGYTFAGWKIVRSNGDDWKEAYVTVGDGEVWYLTGESNVWTLWGDAYDSSISGNVSITLSAVWTPVVYNVLYDSATLYGNDISSLPTSCDYDKSFIINQSFGQTMFRTGYTFLGWRIAGTAETPSPAFIIEASTRTENITLEAVWQAKTYTMTLDPGNGDRELNERGTETISVTFDAALPRIDLPSCDGWDFMGYYLGETLYYNADGTPAVGTWVNDGERTLHAQWRIRIGEWVRNLYLTFADYRGGENVENLLRTASDRAEALDLSAADYLEKLNSIEREVEAEIGFEKCRDDAIAALRAYYTSLAATQAYNDDGSGELKRLLAQAVEAVNSPETISEAEIDRISASAHLEMDAVRINYLSSVAEGCEVHMNSPKGLSKGAVLSAESGDASLIRAQLSAATSRGTILLQTGDAATVEDARRMLSAKDVMAFYRLSLSEAPQDGDLLEFRLLIPEKLRSETGFAVACYDNRTETVTLLATHREGNELVFYAPSASDVAVFVDHVTDTVPILAVLICVLLLQIVVIAALLIGKRRNRVRAVALPLFVMLAVHVSPNGSLPAVAILLAVAVVLQFVLMYLIFSTRPFRRKSRKTEKPAPEKEQLSILQEDGANSGDEQAPPLASLTENDLPQGSYETEETLDPELSEDDNSVDWMGVRIADDGDFPNEASPREDAVPASVARMFDEPIWEESENSLSRPKAEKKAIKAETNGKKNNAGDSFSEQAKGIWGETPPRKQAPTFSFDDEENP